MDIFYGWKFSFASFKEVIFMKKIFILLLFTTTMLTAQNKVANNFYSLSAPSNTNVKSFQSSHEELANIDSFQFFLEDKPKYIFYMMSNKLETSATVSLENYKDYVFDLGELDITNAEMFNSFIKVYFNYKNKKSIEGVVYIGIRNNILNRFLLMYPNKSALDKFDKEVNIMLNDVDYKKSSWDK